MLQSLKRARAVDPGDGGLHEAVVDFVLLGVYVCSGLLFWKGSGTTKKF